MSTSKFLDDLQPMFTRLRLMAMYEHAQTLAEDIDTLKMSHVDWLHELFSAEIARRDENALKRRIHDAGLSQMDACLSNVDYSPERKLDQGLITSLGSCDWLRKNQNCIITGKTGCGKTWLAGALTIAACQAGFTALFVRVPQFLREVAAMHNMHSELENYFRRLQKVDLLVLDDWGIGKIDNVARSDLLEIIEQRRGNGSLMITSVLPVSAWAQYINDPTYSDSILDRVVFNSHRIEIEGDSMRSKIAYGAIEHR